MTAGSKIIRAVDYCQPEDSPVDSAHRLARAILELVRVGDSVTVSMDGIPGASSSFFNVIFSELAAGADSATVDRTVAFAGLGKTQTLIERRSRTAVLGSGN